MNVDVTIVWTKKTSNKLDNSSLKKLKEFIRRLLKRNMLLLKVWKSTRTGVIAAKIVAIYIVDARKLMVNVHLYVDVLAVRMVR